MKNKINWRYAFGELLIVIIGITIAFALNNWATGIKNKKVEKEYLLSIQSDLDKDIEDLDSNIAQLDIRIQYISSLLPYLGNGRPGGDTLVMRLFRYVDPLNFNPSEITIQSMKFSGDLKLIKDIELKNEIIEHYKTYEGVDDQIKRHETFARDFVAKYFMDHIDFARLRSGLELEFLHDPYFRNMIYSLYGIFNLEKQAHQSALLSAKQLKSNLSQLYH